MILEALLLTTLLLLLGSASYTDCRVSHIWNRHLGYAAVPIFLLDFAYYSPLVGDGLAYWQPFLLNAVCLALTGLLLYALHIWAAGGSSCCSWPWPYRGASMAGTCRMRAAAS